MVQFFCKYVSGAKWTRRVALAMGSVSPCALPDTAPFVVLFFLLLLCFLFCYICGCRFVALDLLFLVLTIQAVKRRCSLLVHCSNRIVRMYADFTDFSALSQTMPDDPKNRNALPRFEKVPTQNDARICNTCFTS